MFYKGGDKIYIIGRCAYPLDDNGHICGKELHIHLNSNKGFVKKIRNRCVHVIEVNGGRVSELEGIVFLTDKKQKKMIIKKRGGK